MLTEVLQDSSPQIRAAGFGWFKKVAYMLEPAMATKLLANGFDDDSAEVRLAAAGTAVRLDMLTDETAKCLERLVQTQETGGNRSRRERRRTRTRKPDRRFEFWWPSDLHAGANRSGCGPGCTGFDEAPSRV